MKMMPLNICLTLLAALALCLAACTGRHTYPRPLLEADSLADLRPDSALALLQAYEDSARHISRPDSMYLALLKIKATDKLYIPRDTTDGILDIVSYYEHGGDRRLLPMAYYYLASAYRDCAKPLSAVDLFYKALYSAEENGDSMTQARCFSQIAAQFYYNGLYYKAVNTFLSAHRIDSMLGNTHRMALGLRDIANCYRETDDYDLAAKYFLKALDIAQMGKDKNAESTICAQFARLYEEVGKYAEAEKYLKVAISYGDSAELSAVLSIASGLYRTMGLVADAKRCDEMVVAIGNNAGKRAASDNLYRYYSSKGQTDSAIHYFNIYKKYTDTINNMRANDYLAAKANLNGHLSIPTEDKARHLHFIYVVAAMVLSVGIGLTFVVLYRRRKSNDAEKQGECETPQQQGCTPERQTLSEVSVKIDKRLALDPIVMKFKRIGALKKDGVCDTDGKLTGEDWKALDQLVNTVHQGFKQKLMEHDLNILEYRVCLLLKTGLSISEISRIVFQSRSSISVMRKRMYVKFFGKDGRGSDFDAFILSL